MTTIINGSSPSITFSDGSAQTSATRPFLNRIINGAMVIDQRNAGASVTPTDGQYTLDRWLANVSQASKLTVQQNAGSVTPPAGFANYLGVTSSSSYSITSTDYFVVSQKIEGFNTADLNWGSASAKTITISFWVRSSLTGTFGGALNNNDGNRWYPFSYTISAANTWEQKSITVAGDTTGTWGTTNGVGIQLRFSLGTGSTYSASAGSWITSPVSSVTGAVSVVGTNGATFYITGVQLEVGSTATSFDYRPYTTELQLAQRYFWSSGAGITATVSSFAIHGSGAVFDTDSSDIVIRYPVNMRTAPTVTFSNVACASNSEKAVTAINDVGSTLTTAFLRCDHSSGFTAGYGAVLYNGNNANGFVRFSSEL